MARGKLAAVVAALGLLVLAPTAAAVVVPKEVFYRIKLVGTQTTTWSYRGSVTELGCVRSVSGSGSERYDFSTPRILALVRQYRGTTSIELGRTNGVFTQHVINGQSNESQSGDCTPRNENGDTSGCGRDTLHIELLLVEKPSSIQWIPQTSKFYDCPSGGPGGSGGHRPETIAGHINWRELLRSRAKKVHAEVVRVKDIKGFYGRVIGQERTEMWWTLTFQRGRR